MLREMIRNEHPMARPYNLANVVAAWEIGADIIGRGAPALVVAHAPKSYPHLERVNAK